MKHRIKTNEVAVMEIIDRADHNENHNPSADKAKDVSMDNNHSSSENSEENIPPWYKQFWPWFLFGLPGFVVVAGIATVFIAFYQADSTVSDKYYKEGLAINETVHDLQRADAMNLSAAIDVDVSVWKIKLSADKAITDDHLIVELQHPLDSSKDQSFTLFNAGNHTYRGTLSDVDVTRWYIDIYPHGKQGTADSWRLKGEIDLGNKTTRLKNR